MIFQVRFGQWFELDWTGRPNHFMAARHVVLAGRKLMTYVYAVGRFWWQPSAFLWFPSSREEGGNHMVRVLVEVSLWQEDGHCGNEQVEMVSPPSALVVYPLDLSFDGVLVPLDRVSSSPCAIESWPSIDQEILSKRVLHVLDFNVPRYIPVIGLQAYVFLF
ncbi:hypothetical protein TIFTF001_029471 [Ficus carica]|uniref:Uncharacterized protein n=1 Tax=Ficus carica TaxID=3494 RepID=A0AA88DW16_FICCA|nr:hypothetical protein TIFTF001_029471 [Ficus carica]